MVVMKVSYCSTIWKLKYAVRKFFIIRECKKFQSNAIFENFKTFSFVDDICCPPRYGEAFSGNICASAETSLKKKWMAADAFPARPPYTHTTCVRLVAWVGHWDLLPARKADQTEEAWNSDGHKDMLYQFPPFFGLAGIINSKSQAHWITIYQFFQWVISRTYLFINFCD